MSGTNKDNTRAEEFKRATAGVLRAIAEVPDVQVAFQPGPSGSPASAPACRAPRTRALPPAEMALPTARRIGCTRAAAAPPR